MKIRKMAPSDIPALDRLVEATFLHHQLLLPEEFAPSAAPPDSGDWVSPDVICFVADSDGLIEGYLKAKAVDAGKNRLFRKKRVLMIDDLSVSPDARCEGTGTILLEAAETYAKEHGFAEVRLSVWAENSGAIRFYDKSGYRPLRTTLRKTL